MKVYVDDTLVKSKTATDHIAHISDTFAVLRKYREKVPDEVESAKVCIWSGLREIP